MKTLKITLVLTLCLTILTSFASSSHNKEDLFKNPISEKTYFIGGQVDDYSGGTGD